MSTNFYARSASTTGEGLHIGKRSAGWEFLFRAHPHLGLTSSKAWHAWLSLPGVRIVSDTEIRFTLHYFWLDAGLWQSGVSGPGLLKHRFHAMSGEADPGDLWRDERGCPFADYDFR